MKVIAVIAAFVLLGLIFTGWAGCATTGVNPDGNTGQKPAPSITVIQPKSGDIVYKKLEITFSLAEFVESVAEIRAYIDNQLVYTMKEGQFRFILDIGYLADKSSHFLRLEVLGSKGTLLPTANIPFSVDSQIPQYIINQMTVKDKTLTVNADPISDSGISMIEVYVDGKLYKTYTDNYSNLLIDLQSLSSGNHEIKLVIYDSNGNIKTIEGINADTKQSTVTLTPTTTTQQTQTQQTQTQQNQTQQTQQTQNTVVNPPPFAFPHIEYPGNRKGLLADVMTYTISGPAPCTMEISEDPFFEIILDTVAVGTSTTVRVEKANKTGIYFARFVKDGMKSPIHAAGLIKDNTVVIKGATFTMGNDSSDVFAEKPEHDVVLSDYRISRYATTNYEYLTFLRCSGYKKGTISLTFKDSEGNLPVTGINWYDAKSYCDWLGVRLPTESEWEYAAAGGEKVQFSWGNDKGGVSGNSVGNQDGFPGKAPVDSYKPNKFGLFNMSGNVWQWCADWYDPYYYRYSPSIDPQGPSNGTSKVIRGGSFKDELLYLRITTRGAINSYSTLDNVGFRIAMTVSK